MMMFMGNRLILAFYDLDERRMRRARSAGA